MRLQISLLTIVRRVVLLFPAPAAYCVCPAQHFYMLRWKIVQANRIEFLCGCSFNFTRACLFAHMQILRERFWTQRYENWIVTYCWHWFSMPITMQHNYSTAANGKIVSKLKYLNAILIEMAKNLILLCNRDIYCKVT